MQVQQSRESVSERKCLIYIAFGLRVCGFILLSSYIYIQSTLNDMASFLVHNLDSACIISSLIK